MKNTARKVILIVVAVILVIALLAAGFLFLPLMKNDKQESITGLQYLQSLNQVQEPEQTATEALKVNTIKFMPYAYLGEAFDLREVLLMEDGVEYSATACYVEVSQDEVTKEFSIKEGTLEVKDLCFTPEAIAENIITLSAKRGSETASKVIYIPTTIHAEPLDDLYKSSGPLGGSDPGISKSVNIDPLYLQGDTSTTSLHVEFNSMDPHPWGNLFLSFSSPDAQQYFTDQVWENAIVTFWVYNPMDLPIEFQLRIVDETAHTNLDWNGADGPHKQRAEPGQWTQLFFSLRKLGTTNRLTANKYSNDMISLKFRYDGYNTEVAYSFDFYMDNIDVVDASMYPHIDTKYVLSNETLDQGWENMSKDIGWQGVYCEYDYENIQGEGSTCSLKAMFNNDKALTNSFICLSPETNPAFNGNLDMTGGKLGAYFKFENMDAKVSFDIVNKKWETSNKVDMDLTSVGDGWYYGEIDLEDVQVGNYRNDTIIRIRFHFYGVSLDSVVFMDTCKFDYKHVEKVYEAVSTDWINMSPDSGSFYFAGEKDFSTSYLKGGDSVRSLKLVAPSDAIGKYTWNTGAAASSGEISAEPNMSYGTLGAWFYFGKQLPNANFVLTNDKWKGSTPVPFIFTKNSGDGWYYGEVNGSSLVCPEGGGTTKVIRMMVQIPKGYTVYIDNLSWNPKYEGELVAAEIDPSVLYDGGDMLSDVNNIVYDKRHWENVENTDDFDNDGNVDPDLTTGLSCGVSTDKVTGPYSVRSWYFKASADNKFGNAVAQLPLSKAYDMTGKNLSFDILVDTDCMFQQPISFRLQTKAGWANINEINPTIKVNPGEWKHVVISFEDVALSADRLKDLGFISITFDFATTTGFERTIYIDNVLLTNEEVTAPEEPLVKGDIPETDWTNMVQDVGSFYHASQVNEIDMSMHYGEESIKSLHFVAPDDKNGMFTFNSEYAVTKGEIPSYPCLNEGMLTAWFYFGDQAPSAKLRVTDKAWKGSIDVPFIFNEAPVDGWYHGKLNCASISYTEINNPEYAIRITITIPAGYDIYVDNMVFDPTPVVMGPEWLYDGGDLLANATLEWNPAEWDGDPYSYDSQSADIYTENEVGAFSVKSWKFYTEKNDLEGTSGVQIHLRNKFDLTGKNMEFDVKFVNAQQTIGIELFNNWKGLQPDQVSLLTVSGDGSEGWQTITISAEDLYAAIGEQDHNEIMLIRFKFDFRTEVEGEHAVYIDNVRFTESDFFEVRSDLLANAVVDSTDWTEENGLVVTQDTENITGDASTRSWMFQANADAAIAANAKFTLPACVDMTGRYLVFEVKTVADQSFTVQLLNELGEELTAGYNVTITVPVVEEEDDGAVEDDGVAEVTEEIPADDVWATVLVDINAAVNEEKDLTAVYAIVFSFDFSVNTGSERTVNVDNVRLVDAETAENDWIHLDLVEIEENISGVLSLNGEYLKAEGSTASLMISSPADDYGFVMYDASSLDFALMHRGTLSAWFYFGDQEPAAYLAAIDSGFNTVVEDLMFVFGENQDGWYEGTADLSQLKYEEGVVPSYILSFGIAVPEGYTVFIDGMHYTDITETAADDMIHLHSNNIATITSDMVYGNMSIQSLFVPAAGKAANMDFVPAEAMSFADGKITAWFYFGENVPGTVRFVAYSGASNSGYVTFTFSEGVDGWYLGTADMADVAAAKQNVLNSVDKFRIQVAKGADIYLDNLIFTANVVEEIPEETEPVATEAPEVTPES